MVVAGYTSSAGGWYALAMVLVIGFLLGVGGVEFF